MLRRKKPLKTNMRINELSTNFLSTNWYAYRERVGMNDLQVHWLAHLEHHLCADVAEKSVGQGRRLLLRMDVCVRIEIDTKPSFRYLPRWRLTDMNDSSSSRMGVLLRHRMGLLTLAETGSKQQQHKCGVYGSIASTLTNELEITNRVLLRSRNGEQSGSVRDGRRGEQSKYSTLPCILRTM